MSSTHTGQHQHAKGTSRIRAPALKVRTNFMDITASSGKAKAIASADWRKTALAVSSSGSSLRTGTASTRERSMRSSSGMSSSVIVEVENINPAPVNIRRRSEEDALWDMIVPARTGRSATSTSDSLSGLSVCEVTAVQFKDMKSMTVNVNGEDILLPNRFSFDIVPVNTAERSGTSSSKVSIGELKRVNGPRKFHLKPSDELLFPHDLPDDLQMLLTKENGVAGSSNAFSGFQPDFGSSRRPRNLTKSAMFQRSSEDSAMGCFRSVQTEPEVRRKKSTEDDDARFQMLLRRLNEDKAPPADARQTTSASAFDIRKADPSIVAAKVKNHGAAEMNSEAVRRNQEFVDRLYEQLAAQGPKTGQEGSQDSGYATGSTTQDQRIYRPSDASGSMSSVIVQRPQGQETFESPTKKLNPTAQEFKSTSGMMAMLNFSPKKLSRPPLTNLFPNMARPATSIEPGVQTMRDSQYDPNQLTDAVASQPRPCFGSREAMLNGAVSSEHLFPDLQNSLSLNGINPRPCFGSGEAMFGGAISSEHPFPDPQNNPPLDGTDAPELPPYMGMFAPPKIQGQQPVEPFPFAPPMFAQPAMSASPLANNFGTFNSPGLPFSPLEMAQFNLANPNGFNTFPYHGGRGPMGAQPRLPDGFNLGNTVTSPFAGAPLPHVFANEEHLFGPDGKINRPHFPVTQKPRDHDPVKQQQYEAYLEWRKANEPGYHMRCKMRQAHRVVRQCQNQQQGKPGNAA
ncbi:hypothetical protein B0T24DRAFT_261768 [Lasiosphaeria ovina]|uniref:Uncharacterized protein n=1 Tax=Lasiosphaeria ovina TaxID=92902 RepID=A0AAE0KB58_9PEZI|nr:hypothetical protein B0T24DRAFT_261768 [Lasiosphaeria ovina]